MNNKKKSQALSDNKKDMTRTKNDNCECGNPYFHFTNKENTIICSNSKCRKTRRFL